MAQLDRIPKKGKVYRFRDLLFWAQGGCICVEDTAMNGDYRVMKQEDFVARLIMFRECIRKDRFDLPTNRVSVNPGRGDLLQHERAEAENFIVDGCAAVKEAGRQGNPFDPKVMAQQARDRETQRGYVYLGTEGSLWPQLAATGFGRREHPGKRILIEPGRYINANVYTERDRPADAARLPPMGTVRKLEAAAAAAAAPPPKLLLG